MAYSNLHWEQLSPNKCLQKEQTPVTVFRIKVHIILYFNCKQFWVLNIAKFEFKLTVHIGSCKLEIVIF